MNEDKQRQEVAKALGLSSLLPAAYNDLLSPAARELGEGLATIAKAVKIALAPVEATVWGYEKIRQWLSLRVTKILADRKVTEVIPPPLTIAGPLTLQMIFASEEPDLREMYANLLASAMDARTAGDAHPSFVTLIQQLTPDEARIVSLIASLNQKWVSWDGKPSAKLGSDDELWEKLRKFCFEAKIKHTDKVDIYIENLIRLRLLRHQTWSTAEYHPEGAGPYGDWDAKVTNDDYEYVELTAYGRAFINSCVAKSS